MSVKELGEGCNDSLIIGTVDSEDGDLLLGGRFFLGILRKYNFGGGHCVVVVVVVVVAVVGMY